MIIAPHITHLDDAVWQECRPVKIEHYWSGEPAPLARHAEARICWSDEALHVRFVCEQHEPLIVTDTPVTDKKTLGLWDRDVCEIFLAPDPENTRRYFEFEAAPTGEWVDLGIVLTPSGRETDWDYRSGMAAGAKVEAGKVVVEMRIPWSESIPKPERGAVWRVNLFRCVGPESPERYLAWRPTKTPEPNYHVPEAFGSLVFS
jgi:hypothetical protein